MTKKMAIPHPSITGMAAGGTILNWLNDADGSYAGSSFLQRVKEGNASAAFLRLLSTSRALVTWSSGRKTLFNAVLIGAGGAAIRKWAGNPKIGGTKLYFKI